MADYKKIHISTLLKYYKRIDIQEAIVGAADYKEIAISYGGTGYGKRPDTLKYPKDVLEMVRQGGTSFHCSEELWYNPRQLVTGMKPQEMNELRKGWDLVLDIDCKELEYSKIASDLLVQALRHHGVQHVSVKFSGNHGFHIVVPFEAFPETVSGQPVQNLFPEGPRKIAGYLQWMIKDHLAKRLLEKASVTVLAQNIDKTTADITKDGQLDPFKVLSIDTVLIASRHLYRMPYSLNEKSGLASVVITPEQILTFNKEDARPEKVVSPKPFINRNVVPGEAKKLLVQAMDHKVKIDAPTIKKVREYEPIAEAIPEQHFPPCIQHISKGLADGKKRAVFILLNFLHSCGWSYEMIEEYLDEWNERNVDPLREVYIKGQMRHHKAMKKRIMPPNCMNRAYMIDLGACKPDGFCRANSEPSDENFAPRIKNPANYAIIKQRNVAQHNKKGKDEKPHSKPL